MSGFIPAQVSASVTTVISLPVIWPGWPLKKPWLPQDTAADDIDLIVLGSTTPEEICPNTASYIKNKLGASKAAAFDLNSACTSWFYGLNAATDMIRAGSINKALVIGSERLSLAMDWKKRESCFLFGDGAGAVLIEASDHQSGSALL